MKKITLFMIALVLSAFQFLSAYTWNAPSYKGEIPVTGTAYYIYNIGSNGFLNRGAWWATQACVTTHTKANASTNINKWTSVNTSGSTWTFQYNNNGSNIANNFLFDTGGGTDVFTDNSTNNTFTVTENDATNHIYTIQSPLAGGNYIGSEAATENTNKGIANVVRPNRATLDDYSKWKFVSQANYDLFQAKVALDRYMTYANEKGGIDLTSYISTYDADVTADINTASTNLLALLAPVNATSLISNPSFESGFTGWTNSGFATQTNTPPFTKNGTTYAERWVSGGSNLPTSTITQTVSVPNGVYQLVVSAHAFQQNGSNPLHTFAFATCGSKTVEISAPNDNYIIDNVEVTGGSLTVGYKLEGAIACNWTGFDNFKLYRYITYSTPGLSASASTLRYDDIYSSSDVTIGGSNLTSDITITTPSGITLSGTNVTGTAPNYTILAANANASNTITVTYDKTSSVNGAISINASGSGSVAVSTSVKVKASTNVTCYTPLYPSGNMIADPTFSNSILSFSNGGYAGWGPKAVDIKNPYCGAASAYILGSCWPNGGSLDRGLNSANGNALKPNTTYRLRAMVNSQASTGSFQFEIAGYDGSASKYFQIPNTSGWVQFDQTFTTGTTVTEQGIYFNSCTTPPAVTDTCFIDNYELYEVPTGTGLNNQFQNKQLVYVQGDNVVSEFQLNQQSVVTFTVVDLQGKVLVKSVETLPAGKNKQLLKNTFSTGIYLIKITCNEFVATNKLIIR